MPEKRTILSPLTVHWYAYIQNYRAQPVYWMPVYKINYSVHPVSVYWYAYIQNYSVHPASVYYYTYICIYIEL